MNIILDVLPETVQVDGKAFFVDTDFRTFIIFEKIINDKIMSAQEKVENVLNLFYTEEIPKDIEQAVNAIIDLYRCGEKKKSSNNEQKKNGEVELKQPEIYDYIIDAPYIYGAFLSQYNIDLNEIEYLHWWKFQALFKSLESHCKIVEIMGYRAVDLGKIEDKKERERYARLKNIYALPENLTKEEKIARAGMAFAGGMM